MVVRVLCATVVSKLSFMNLYKHLVKSVKGKLPHISERVVLKFKVWEWVA